MLAFAIGINNASLTILSQQKGRDDDEGLRRYLNGFVIVLTVLAIIMGTFGYIFAESLLNLLGTPKAMLQEAKLYLQINFLGIIFYLDITY